MTSRLILSLVALPCFAYAADLHEASINQIVNEVKVIDPRLGARSATLKETIKDDLGVATGPQSRAELLFQDNTLTRLGAETFFHFKAGTRDLTLDKGTMLLQVPKGHGGAHIRTGSVTASITGTTIMMEHLPRKQVRVLVLEGSLRLSLNNRPGESRELTAGRMLTLDPAAKRMPESVAVDLRKVVGASRLIDPRGFKGNSNATPAVLPSLGLIRREIALQDRLGIGVDADRRPRTTAAAANESSLKTNNSATRAQEATVAKVVEIVKASGLSGSNARLVAASLGHGSSSVTDAKQAVTDAVKSSQETNVSGEDKSGKKDKSGKDGQNNDNQHGQGKDDNKGKGGNGKG